MPYVPGRHIITEAGSFVELHAATYKPKHAVHLFLLNDAMLVSQKKHRGAGIGGPSRLVAERCFTLSEIVVVDLKDAGGAWLVPPQRRSQLLTGHSSTDLQNAIKVKRGKETIIYRTDKPENKKMLLLAFKKVAEELINRKRKEMLNEAEARKGDVSILFCDVHADRQLIRASPVSPRACEVTGQTSTRLWPTRTLIRSLRSDWATRPR